MKKKKQYEKSFQFGICVTAKKKVKIPQYAKYLQPTEAKFKLFFRSIQSHIINDLQGIVDL